MFMQQHHDKARERLLEIMARDEQRAKVMARSAEADGPGRVTAAAGGRGSCPCRGPEAKEALHMMSFEDEGDDDDDLF